jgi:MFS family permease
MTRLAPTLPLIDLVETGVLLVLPALLIDQSKHGGLWYGTLIGSWSTGRLLGLLLARRFIVRTRKGVLLALNAVIQGTVLLAAGLWPTLPWMMLCFLIIGVPSGCASVCVNAYIQTRIEENLRGRIFALLGAVVALSMPLGPVISGLIAHLASPALSLVVLGAVLAAVGLSRLTSRQCRRPRNSALSESVCGAVVLHVPASVVKTKSAPYLSRGKPACRNPLVNETDYVIVGKYGIEYRGIVQYYLLASDVQRLHRLRWVMETSMLKTLARKHRSSVTKMAARFKAKITTPHGPRTCFEASLCGLRSRPARIRPTWDGEIAADMVSATRVAMLRCVHVDSGWGGALVAEATTASRTRLS